VLQCEGTPRACCSEAQATSRAVEAQSKQAATQPSVSVVRPNEIPKVVGLRHDSGPAADPPTTAQTAACSSPVAINASPKRSARRW